MSRANSEIIRAWADGSEIQYQQGGKWIDFDPTQLPWSMDRVYRVKPLQRWYRVARMQYGGKKEYFAIAEDDKTEFQISAAKEFIAWASDRVYLETDE